MKAEIDSFSDDLLYHRLEEIELGKVTDIACHLAASVPTVYNLDKRMRSPRIVADLSKSDLIADLIMHRLLFNEWKECEMRISWQIAFRTQYAYDTLVEIGKNPDIACKKVAIIEACAGIATLAAYTYNENAGVWLGNKTTAEDILQTDDMCCWPLWPEEGDEHLQKLAQRYTKIISMAKGLATRADSL